MFPQMKRAHSWLTREDRVRWLQEYQRDLQQQAADVAEENKGLQEGPQSADQPPESRAARAQSGLPTTCGGESCYDLA